MRSDGGSCGHADRDAAAVLNEPGDGRVWGEEENSSGVRFGAQAIKCRRWAGMRRGAGLHPQEDECLD